MGGVMAMTDVRLTPSPEPSRGRRLRIRACDIFRLWPGDDAQEVLRNLRGGAGKAGRVAAVLPGQDFSAEDYEALEDAGVLVVEVPVTLAQSSDASIADYFTKRLNEGANATVARMTAIGTAGPPPVEREDELRLSIGDESELIEFVNDPAKQLGGHF